MKRKRAVIVVDYDCVELESDQLTNENFRHHLFELLKTMHQCNALDIKDVAVYRGYQVTEIFDRGL